MTGSILLVFGILLGTVVLFVSDRIRLDVAALLSLLALTLLGILEPDEALAGFADPVVLMIAALFVVGEGLFQTGVAQAMGRLPARLSGDSEIRLLVAIMILVAFLSAFMSSTGTVAVMLPVVMGLAWGKNLSPSKLLIPLSVASLLGGMLTLIGTAPNIVVSNHLESMGRDGFSFFAFTPVGLVVVALGIGFMALVGYRILPDRPSPSRPVNLADQPTVQELADTYELPPALFRLRIAPASALAGGSLLAANLPDAFGLTVVSLRPPESAGSAKLGRSRKSEGAPIEVPGGEAILQEGSELTVQGSADGVARLVGRGFVHLLDPDGEDAGDELTTAGGGMAEVLLTPRSRLLGKHLIDLRFRDRYGLSVVGIKRLGRLLEGDIRRQPLRFGDTLLVQGPWNQIRLLQGERRDFVVPLAPREMIESELPLGKAPLAVAIMVGMMVLLTLGVVPAVTAVLMAAVAMVLTGCVNAPDAYRSVNWESVVLIAAILPMATALEKTGGMALIVEGLSGVMEGRGPLLLLAALFLLTSALSQVISNTATAVLLAPIAYQLALGIGAAPEAFMMTIAVAASTAFATPVASPANTLVLGPGGYHFGDFFKVGIALQFLILLASLAVIPLLFPF